MAKFDRLRDTYGPAAIRTARVSPGKSLLTKESTKSVRCLGFHDFLPLAADNAGDGREVALDGFKVTGVAPGRRQESMTGRLKGLKAKHVVLTALLTAAAFMAPQPAAARDHDDATSVWGLFQFASRGDARAPAPRDRAAYMRQVVKVRTAYAAGTILIDSDRRFLYLVKEDGTAIRYGVGVGRPGFEWTGTHKISRKAEWPDWVPPQAMRLRQPFLPAFMPGGPDNPLGARALYIGSTLYRIHGTNEARTIGEAVSSGCIRMLNEDVIDLYERVQVGTKVVVF